MEAVSHEDIPAAPAFLSFAELVQWRRDVRRFLARPVAPELLARIVALADLAPSVGNSQPWRIVNVGTPAVRDAIRANFAAANAQAETRYTGSQRDDYRRLKLAGFDAAPVHLAVFCDRATLQGHRLGRDTMPETLDYSCVCMIMTLWLAARAEGLGVGWVSILDPAQVKAVLNVPADWSLIGYLLVGFPQEEHIDPELERYDWQKREPPNGRYVTR